MDRRAEDVVISGNVIADLTYEPMEPGEFSAVLEQAGRAPLYKHGGFFVFTNVVPGDYVLRLLAQHFQPQEFPVTIPYPPDVFDSPLSLDTTRAFSRPGDNELIIVVQGVNSTTGRISFSPEILTKSIPPGSQVLALGFSAQLAEKLEPGLISSASLSSAAGLVTGDIVRIIRGESVRMRYDPYDDRPSSLTHITGRIALADDPSVSIAGAQVRLTQVDGLSVTTTYIEGAHIAVLGSGASTVVLGTDADITAATDDAGTYTIYSTKAQNWTSVTLQVSKSGFLPQTLSFPVFPLQRNRADFLLVAS